MHRFGRAVFPVTAVLLLLLGRTAAAIDVVADDPANTASWHFAEKTLTATYLGGDKASTAVLILNKAAVMGRAITIVTDGPYIFILPPKTDSPKVFFEPVAKAEGATSKLLLTAGDSPTIVFNDKEQVQQQGKWIQICSSLDLTFRLEVGTATYVKITFDPPILQAKPAPAPPALPAGVPAGPDLLHTISAQKLLSSSNNFHEGVLKKCLQCNGTGKVTTRVQTGTRDSGGLSYPVYENRTEKCPRCGGTGIDRANDETLIRLSGQLVKNLALLKPDDPKKQETLTKVYGEITDQMIGDHKTWVCLTANGKSILAQTSPANETTVVALVQVKKSMARASGHRRYLVRVIGTDKEVYVDDPVLADELKSGHALMGGLVDKQLSEPGADSRATVLRGGFLIAPQVQKDWWWWYRDRK